jgi:hypothetical protein
MSRKVFTAGEVLAAADVNSFLMDQTVMSFAGTAARGSAISSPVEGMTTFLEDSNILSIYDGSNWKTSLGTTGGILQVVSTTMNDVFSASVSANSWVLPTGFTATITPKSTSSKILIHAHVNGSNSNANFGIGLLIFRNGTKIANAINEGSRTSISSLNVGANSSDGMSHASMTFLDSPSSTSALSYDVNIYNYQGATNTMYLNRSHTDGNISNYPRTISSITLMEVSA